MLLLFWLEKMCEVMLNITKVDVFISFNITLYVPSTSYGKVLYLFIQEFLQLQHLRSLHFSPGAAQRTHLGLQRPDGEFCSVPSSYDRRMWTSLSRLLVSCTIFSPSTTHSPTSTPMQKTVLAIWSQGSDDKVCKKHRETAQNPTSSQSRQHIAGTTSVMRQLPGIYSQHTSVAVLGRFLGNGICLRCQKKRLSSSYRSRYFLQSTDSELWNLPRKSLMPELIGSW